MPRPWRFRGCERILELPEPAHHFARPDFAEHFQPWVLREWSVGCDCTLFLMETQPPATAWIAPAPRPLLIRDFFTRTRTWAPDRTITFRNLRTLTYSAWIQRVEQAARVLADAGVRPGTRVGVLDWDSHRYLELFFAIPMLGAVLHTVNVRLTPDQMAYTIRHAEDTVLMLHPDFLKVAGEMAPQLPGIRTWISLSDEGIAPASPLPFRGDYEALLAAAPAGFAFPDLDENTVATLFYTTGTTGDPKGVYFTHRQIVLHATTGALTFAAHTEPLTLHDRDVYLPLTPMFHVQAWGFPYIAVMLGLQQVYPGRFEPSMILSLLEQHRVTISHCVPTLLQMLLHHPDSSAVDWSRLKVVIGGAPLPVGLAQLARSRGIRILGGYGMSETGPLAAISHVKPDHPLAAGTSPADALDVVTRTGFPMPLVDAGIMDAAGTLLPPGRENVGELVLRAPWLTAGYHRQPEASAALWRGGWLHTGDIAYLDTDGYIRITDRLKDVIKIGGEWISTLELENCLSQHEAVKEVVVVGVPDSKWDEHPHADVVLRPGLEDQVTPKVLAHFLHRFVDEGALHKRAILTSIRIVPSIARTSVGKFDKKRLRAELAAGVTR